MSLILHPLSKKKFDSYIKNPPQVLLIVSPSGSGKKTLSKDLALRILGDKPAGRLYQLEPLTDKKSISIDAIRELKNTLRLKSDKKRVVLINNAGLLTKEAQNSLLKILEEPPKDVHFLLTVDAINDLLETIRSRSSIWRLTMPSKKQILESFSGYDKARVQKAVAIAGNKVGLIANLIDETNEKSILINVNTAKELLSESHFKRLVTANQISKDSKQTNDTLEALVLVCHAALRHSASTNAMSTNQWQKRLSNTLKAQGWLANNVQPKLVLSYLFIVL